MKKKLLSLVTVFSFVSCLVSCSNEKVVNNNNYSEQEKAKIEALMKLFDSYGWELDTTVSIEQRDKELLEMDYERAKTFLEYMSNGIEFDNLEYYTRTFMAFPIYGSHSSSAVSSKTTMILSYAGPNLSSVTIQSTLVSLNPAST